MIISGILNLLAATLNLLIGLLPDKTDLPSTWTTAWDWITNLGANFLYVIPEGITLLNVAGTFILLLVSLFIWKIANWIYNKLRGSGQ